MALPLTDAELLEFLLSPIDPERFINAEHDIRTRFGLYSRTGWSGHAKADRHARDLELARLAEYPALASGFLFHGDGFIREAALKALDGPLQRPVVAYGLLIRLNDWSAEVRAAAQDAFARCFASTSPDVLLPAILIVFKNARYWGRWDHGYDALVAATVRHQTLFGALSQIMISDTGGLANRLFGALCRNPGMDHLLPRIAVSARHPALRVKALDSLARGTASWLQGTFHRVWTDKIYGRYKLKPDIAARSLTCAVDLPPILQAALQDRSPRVRTVALDSLIARRSDIRFQPLIDQCLASMSDDHPTVKGRLEYLRQTAPPKG